jgi:tetratricopeptide (TPR) repeat protein
MTAGTTAGKAGSRTRACPAACALAGLCALVGLWGCAAGPSTSAPPPVPHGAAVAPPAPADGPALTTDEQALAQFELAQRAAAAAAAQQGRWLEAIWAWEVVLALRPSDRSARAAHAEALAAAQAGVAERLPRARLALQRGESDAAQRLYGEVLALQPGQAEAADALRRTERDRVQRQHLGQSSRPSMLRSSRAQAQRAPTPDEARATVAASNEVEHASLLARDGDLSAAIALLQPLVKPRGGDPVARALLLDLYLRQADVLAIDDKAAAVAMLRRLLGIQPGHPVATRKIGLWQREIARSGARPAPAPAAPPRRPAPAPR